MERRLSEDGGWHRFWALHHALQPLLEGLRIHLKGLMVSHGPYILLGFNSIWYVAQLFCGSGYRQCHVLRGSYGRQLVVCRVSWRVVL